MLRSTVLLIISLICVLAVAGLASAKAASPTPQPTQAVAAQDNSANPGMPDVTPLTLPCCPVCQKLGHVCPNCMRAALAIMAPLASKSCGNCTPDKLCANCCQMVDGAIAQLPKLEVGTLTDPGFPIAYKAGKFSDDRAALITSLVQEASKQGLIGANTDIGSLYPELLSQGLFPSSPVYAFVSTDAGKTPAAPLKSFNIPAGPYLQFQHHGSYQTMGETWLAAFAYCKMHNLKLGSGPCGESYTNDPSTTPEDQLLTNIYIPLAEMPKTTS